MPQRARTDPLTLFVGGVYGCALGVALCVGFTLGAVVLLTYVH